jgi:hypothetical protein
MGLEPTATTLATSCSTTELRPLDLPPKPYYCGKCSPMQASFRGRQPRAIRGQANTPDVRIPAFVSCAVRGALWGMTDGELSASMRVSSSHSRAGGNPTRSASASAGALRHPLRCVPHFRLSSCCAMRYDNNGSTRHVAASYDKLGSFFQIAFVRLNYFTRHTFRQIDYTI